MSDVVNAAWVAVAGSAISGAIAGGLTAYVALRSARIAAKNRLDGDRQQREHEKTVARYAAKRQTFVDFLSAAAVLVDVVTTYGVALRTEHPSEGVKNVTFGDVREAAVALNVAAYRIRLEATTRTLRELPGEYARGVTTSLLDPDGSPHHFDPVLDRIAEWMIHELEQTGPTSGDEQHAS